MERYVIILTTPPPREASLTELAMATGLGIPELQQKFEDLPALLATVDSLEIANAIKAAIEHAGGEGEVLTEGNLKTEAGSSADASSELEFILESEPPVRSASTKPESTPKSMASGGLVFELNDSAETPPELSTPSPSELAQLDQQLLELSAELDTALEAGPTGTATEENTGDHGFDLALAPEPQKESISTFDLDEPELPPPAPEPIAQPLEPVRQVAADTPSIASQAFQKSLAPAESAPHAQTAPAEAPYTPHYQVSRKRDNSAQLALGGLVVVALIIGAYFLARRPGSMVEISPAILEALLNEQEQIRESAEEPLTTVQMEPLLATYSGHGEIEGASYSIILGQFRTQWRVLKFSLRQNPPRKITRDEIVRGLRPPPWLKEFSVSDQEAIDSKQAPAIPGNNPGTRIIAERRGSAYISNEDRPARIVAQLVIDGNRIEDSPEVNGSFTVQTGESTPAGTTQDSSGRYQLQWTGTFQAIKENRPA